jgi:hypothetical protein
MIKGAVIGLMGIAMMTAAQAAQMRISGRPPSMVPGQVAAKPLGLEPADDAALAPSRCACTGSMG